MDELKTVTIEGVELASVGWWEFVSGPRWLTTEDLQAAVDAQEDPAIRTPKIKIGHTDPRFDGQPLFGTVANLRLSDNKQKLIGDYVIAASLAPLVAKASDDDGDAPFGERSVEGWFDYTSATGTEHRFVLTAVSLLGEFDPAIEDLDDIVGIFTDETFLAAAAGSGKRAEGIKLLQAGAVVDRIRMDIWKEVPANDMPWGEWSWVRRVEVDAGSKGFLIVEDDDTARLYRVPWSIVGDDVQYGEAEEVIENYVAASAEKGRGLSFPRKTNRVRGNGDTLTGNEARKLPEQPSPEADVDLAELRKKLALPDDADEATVKAKLDEALEAKDPEAEPAPDEPPAENEPPEKDEGQPEGVAAGKLPEGVVAIDKEQLEELKAQASAGAEARENQRVEERDRFLVDAIKAGKFPPSRKTHYAAMFDKDPEGTKEFVDGLEAGTIPVKERGHAGDSSEEAAASKDEYPTGWLTETERKRVGANQGS